VEFDGVWFHYDPRVPVIRGLSVRIPAGQAVAFVGSTGAGKSTIIKLLLRLYDVTGGAIRLDGVDVRELQLRELRRAIGLVSQDVFLFHGSVRDNIAYGSFDAPLERIIEAAQIAEAHEFIEALPDGYDTIVGERGQKLSGGQRQRISIARAVLKDPPVLILDEATSSVDNETEAAIQRSLERIAVGRTTIVIAHRLSTVRNAHRTFVLEGGQVSEQGTHAELVGAGGIYASLWRVQTGERAA
jgi:ATP-binding cassette, subfamily B, bacterial